MKLDPKAGKKRGEFAAFGAWPRADAKTPQDRRSRRRQ